MDSFDPITVPCPLCHAPAGECCECLGNGLEMDAFQAKSFHTAVYPNKGNNLTYPVIGLCGEAGEVAEKYKKCIRDDKPIVGETRDAIIKELGDVLWYVAAIASELKVTLSEVAEKNLEKLADRRERGTLHGSGDER